MKVRSTLSFFFFTIGTAFILSNTAEAQQYKLRQSTSMVGMKSESTIYVKGMRKRTEGDGFAGMTNLTTIEQCDSQRIIKINDKKKLYYIEPFAKDIEEQDENIKQASVKAKPVQASAKETESRKGGIIYMYYNVTDTGERKKMYGLTARHVWTTQKIKPSADACSMKDSMIIKTDGWYIDLPQFNCTVNGISRTATSGGWQKMDCKDRYVSKRSGKGKLGFPLQETRTMIMGNGSMTRGNFETSIETLEFSTAKLDSMLFEIPLGYKQASSEEELQDKFDPGQLKQYSQNTEKTSRQTISTDEPKKEGVTRIGVYEPKANEQLDVSALQNHLINTLSDGNFEAVAVSSEEEAKKYKCDLLLTTEFTRIKQGSKVGGLLKAIKNTDPFATSSYNIEANLALLKLSDGAVHSQQKIDGKFEGKVSEAAMRALDKGWNKLIQEMN
jgi:hypothetical protein